VVCLARTAKKLDGATGYSGSADALRSEPILSHVFQHCILLDECICSLFMPKRDHSLAHRLDTDSFETCTARLQVDQQTLCFQYGQGRRSGECVSEEAECGQPIDALRKELEQCLNLLPTPKKEPQQT
jgi:hypothetical protein